MKIDVGDIKKFELLPGETLVVSCDVLRIHMKEVTKFVSNFKKLFPDNKLLIMGDSMEITNIIKEEEG